MFVSYLHESVTETARLNYKIKTHMFTRDSYTQGEYDKRVKSCKHLQIVGLFSSLWEMIVSDLWWLVLSTRSPLCSLQLPVFEVHKYIFNTWWIDSCYRENKMYLQMLVWSASHFLLRNTHQLLTACTSAIASKLTTSIVIIYQQGEKIDYMTHQAWQKSITC